jgi:predicted nucleic acid-binding protein
MFYCIYCPKITGKRIKPKQSLLRAALISVQVLNEFASVASRKLKMSYAEIRDALSTVRAVCQIQSVTIDTHERGLVIAERYGFSLYDSMIISSALQSSCTILYSEDMQHGQEFNSQLVIVNLMWLH